MNFGQPEKVMKKALSKDRKVLMPEMQTEKYVPSYIIQEPSVWQIAHSDVMH